MSNTIELLSCDVEEHTISGLSEVLIDTIESGASVGWTETPPIAESDQWWRDHIASDGIDVWIARGETGRILGTVSLLRATKKNGLHRAEVAKLMVHRDGRGQGISAQLMNALETFSRSDSRTLLLLDTQTGSLAESLYIKWDWQTFGIVDGYTRSPDGSSGGTTFMLKRLE